MKLNYNSTRNKEKSYSSSYCIVQGLSEDGGLFVPSEIDKIKFDLEKMNDYSYQELAKEILSKFFSDFSAEQIDYCIKNAYNDKKFETNEIFSVSNTSDFSILELFRGKTIAFKDAALSILPHLIKCAKDNLNIKEDIVILTATSGDTGKAALEGFAFAPSTDVLVFYPYLGVSRLQLLQMLTQKGDNVASFAVKGNFDDTQNGVKEIFNDKEFNEKLKEEGILLSSANSINIGRLMPQVVYYYYTYFKLVKEGKIKLGEKVNFVVPTGNFGNILSGYYAKLTGLPINKLICASNDNNVLFDFFKTGIYDKNREFKKTISPSMDILISSNLERLIYHMHGNDDIKTNGLMEELKKKGKYKVDKKYLQVVSEFVGGYALEAEQENAIKECYNKYNYLMDTHTASGYKVYNDYKKETLDDTYSILLSTASPYKFAKDVYNSIYNEKLDVNDDVSYMYLLNEKTKVKIPDVVNNIEMKEKRDEVVIEKTDMRESILNYLKGKKND